MKVRFLLDENLPPRLKVAILRFNPAIDVLRVGDPNAPPLGTLDPELLRYLELSQQLYDNKQSHKHATPPGSTLGCRWAYLGTVLVTTSGNDKQMCRRTLYDLGNDRGRRVDRYIGLDSVLEVVSGLSPRLFQSVLAPVEQVLSKTIDAPTKFSPKSWRKR